MVLRRRSASLMAGLTLTTAATTASYRQDTQPFMRPLPHQLDAAYDSKGKEGGKTLHEVGGDDGSERLPLSQASLPNSHENLGEFSGGFYPGRSSADKVDLASSRGLNRWGRRDRGGFVDDLDPFESSSPLTVAETSGSETSSGVLSDWLWRPEEEGEKDTSEEEWTWGGALRGVWGALSGRLRVSLELEWHADDGEAKAAEVEALIGEEQRGGVQSYRRRLGTSSSSDSSSSVVLYDTKVVRMTGPTSSDWNGAKYTLAVITPVYQQSEKFGTIKGSETVNETDEAPLTKDYELERGCYEIYTNAGTRPYDVLWKVEVYDDEEEDDGLRDAAEGGGIDQEVFGVGGALCGLSTCYKECYLAAEDLSTDACASYGDLLAPLTEEAGAQCDCTSDEQLELRLACLNRGCDGSSQCYMGNADDIDLAPTLRITAYITTASNSLDEDAIVVAMAQWLDFAPEYVQLTDINGHATDTTSASSSNRRLAALDETLAEAMLETTRHVDGSGRSLQTVYFKRLEFLIISNDAGDFDDAASTIDAGIRGFNTVLAAQDEDSGLTTAEAYTAEYSIGEEDVPASDIPDVDGGIAGTGEGQGVNEFGDIIEGTEAPADDSTDFTREAQFLVGAGLVVVVTIALSIVACVVCHMKRKERKEFLRKNEPVNGRARPVEYVDPWGSVARTFQNDGDTNSTVNMKSGAGSTSNGSHHRSTNGSYARSTNGSHA